MSIQSAQVLLFVFLASVAAGTFLGGPLVDRFGAKFVIWGSILGVLPFTLLLPHLGLIGTVINSIAIGLIISSAFSAMVVYAQELTPGNVGAVAGLFFGLSFGFGGVGAALLGMLADKTSLTFVYHVCAFLPAVGLLGGFLPVRAGQGRGGAKAGSSPPLRRSAESLKARSTMRAQVALGARATLRPHSRRSMRMNIHSHGLPHVADLGLHRTPAR